jgi:hypothetical protein
MGRPKNCGRCNKPKTQCKCGRPPKVTTKIKDKLEKAFAMSFTDEEARLYADLAMSTFYDYCRNNPEFSEKKETLKKKPNIKAKMNILESLNNGDVKDSQWWLERKSKGEFGTKTETDLNIITPVIKDDIPNGSKP